jgi:hypothetical protein
MDGLQDPTPAVVRFTVPQSAVKLHLRSFKRGSGSAYMNDQYTYATKKGASITRNFRAAKRVAVVVTRAPHFGSLKVYIGKKLVKTVQLDGSRVQHRQVVLVKKSTKPLSGTLKIVAASNSRVVVEGVALSSR